MANVKISNLPVETSLAAMTGIAGYNASGTAQISGANIISGAAQPDQNLASVLATGSIATSGQTITLANSASNTSTTMGVNAISSDTSFSIIGTTSNTNLTFTSGGELRFTPNANSGTPAPGDVLAAKNVQGDVEWVTAGGSTPTLQQVVDSGNTADSNGNTGTIVLTDSAQNRTATYSNDKIEADYGFAVLSEDFLTLAAGDGDVFIQADGNGNDITLKGDGMEFQDMGVISLKPNTNIPGVPTSGFSMNNADFLLEGYNQTSSQGGNIRLNSRGNMVIHTGNLSTTTPGGSLSLYARGNTASLSTIDGTTIGGNVTISSSSGDVVITGGENLILTNGGLGTPAVGDVLTAKTTGGIAEWTTPSSGGGLDFSSLNIATIKADLTASSQTQYGQAITVKAAAAIDNGAVVIWDYSGTEVQAKMPSGATPDQHEVIGIAIENIALGATGKVLVYGYVTAKFVPIAGNVVTSVLLDGSSNINGGTTIVSDVNNSTSFQDEGGTGSSYSPNSNYTHTFYNNGGDISMEFVNWDIEQGSGSTQLWDRLGFTVSNDGTTFQNAEFTPHVTGSLGGWRRSTNGIAPWDENESQGSFPNGYILAEQPSTTFPAGSVINTGYKYVRAYFIDDGSTQQAGWEINVYGTQTLSNSSVVAGESVFINPNDLTATSGSGATGRRIGNYVGSNVTNNAVVMFIAPARPQA